MFGWLVMYHVRCIESHPRGKDMKGKDLKAVVTTVVTTTTKACSTLDTYNTLILYRVHAPAILWGFPPSLPPPFLANAAYREPGNLMKRDAHRTSLSLSMA